MAVAGSHLLEVETKTSCETREGMILMPLLFFRTKNSREQEMKDFLRKQSSRRSMTSYCREQQTNQRTRRIHLLGGHHTAGRLLLLLRHRHHLLFFPLTEVEVRTKDSREVVEDAAIVTQAPTTTLPAGGVGVVATSSASATAPSTYVSHPISTSNPLLYDHQYPAAATTQEQFLPPISQLQTARWQHDYETWRAFSSDDVGLFFPGEDRCSVGRSSSLDGTIGAGSSQDGTSTSSKNVRRFCDRIFFGSEDPSSREDDNPEAADEKEIDTQLRQLQTDARPRREKSDFLREVANCPTHRGARAAPQKKKNSAPPAGAEVGAVEPEQTRWRSQVYYLQELVNRPGPPNYANSGLSKSSGNASAGTMPEPGMLLGMNFDAHHTTGCDRPGEEINVAAAESAAGDVAQRGRRGRRRSEPVVPGKTTSATHFCPVCSSALQVVHKRDAAAQTGELSGDEEQKQEVDHLLRHNCNTTSRPCPGEPDRAEAADAAQTTISSHLQQAKPKQQARESFRTGTSIAALRKNPARGDGAKANGKSCSSSSGTDFSVDPSSGGSTSERAALAFLQQVRQGENHVHHERQEQDRGVESSSFHSLRDITDTFFSEQQATGFADVQRPEDSDLLRVRTDSGAVTTLGRVVRTPPSSSSSASHHSMCVNVPQSVKAMGRLSQKINFDHVALVAAGAPRRSDCGGTTKGARPTVDEEAGGGPSSHSQPAAGTAEGSHSSSTNRNNMVRRILYSPASSSIKQASTAGAGPSILLPSCSTAGGAGAGAGATSAVGFVDPGLMPPAPASVSASSGLHQRTSGAAISLPALTSAFPGHCSTSVAELCSTSLLDTTLLVDGAPVPRQTTDASVASSSVPSFCSVQAYLCADDLLPAQRDSAARAITTACANRRLFCSEESVSS
ncbi:unnamed protein product [Amoebophrya sp. A120]|nr:unnamed protein product [Amoebophrya sp. A120]|eukprot:GSA120T00012671001.1